MGVRHRGLKEMDGLKQNILIFLVIILVANVFAYPRTYRPSLKNEVPTKKALENYDDFGLDQSISDYPDNQSLMGAVKEAFIKSFKHKMDFDISTPHGFLAFMNKKFNQSPNPAERNIVFPANRG